MTSSSVRLRCLCIALFLVTLIGSANAEDKWKTPTPEELSMDFQKLAPPGADALYLDREEITEDFHDTTNTFYFRLKILTSKGADRAKVRLAYSVVKGRGGAEISLFEGRAIDPDGTIRPMTIPFAEELISETQDSKTIGRTYTLPAPSIGTILEYRYKIHSLGFLAVPAWSIQSILYTRRAHFLWSLGTGSIKTTHGVETSRVDDTLVWSTQLPPGAEIKAVNHGSARSFELELSDIPVISKEELTPPASNFAYHVNFYFTSYHSSASFWKEEGSRWSDAENAFIGPGPGVKAGVAKFTSLTDTPEQKIKKLYYAVMELDNTSVDAMRGAPRKTDPSEIYPKSSDVILARGWGSADQITNLFIALVRAAGLPAYAMHVPDRARHIFNREDLTSQQLDENIAIVSLDGKEIFLDPGTRFCPFGGLSSRHIGVSGLRQTASGTEIASTPLRPASTNQRLRSANLTMNEKGEVSGTMKLTVVGTAGIISRQIAAVRGEAALESFLKDDIAKTLPAGMEIQITSIDKVKDLEEPLVLQANLKGTAASLDSGKLLVNLNLFESRSEPLFKPETRQLPIYFTVSNAEVDAIHINLPTGFTVSSLPPKTSEKLATGTSYDLNVASESGSITLRRTYILGQLIYRASDYPEVRAFYSKVGEADQKPAELTASR